VQRVVLIFMCLIACLSFGRGSIAHACAPDFAAFVVGADKIAHQDCNQVRGKVCSDDHKGTPHHHAPCHGHKIGNPPDGEQLMVEGNRTILFPPALAGLAPDARPDTAQRPPNA
jgi:hypothetical protein